MFVLTSYYVCCHFFFFKQKTAYEMRISDWSSDVCASDLITQRNQPPLRKPPPARRSAPEPAGAPYRRATPRQPARQRARATTHRPSSQRAAPRRYRQGCQPPQCPDRRHSGLDGHAMRSEEHTSELQSLMRISYAVFCLKKKQ